MTNQNDTAANARLAIWKRSFPDAVEPSWVEVPRFHSVSDFRFTPEEVLARRVSGPLP